MPICSPVRKQSRETHSEYAVFSAQLIDGSVPDLRRLSGRKLPPLESLFQKLCFGLANIEVRDHGFLRWATVIPINPPFIFFPTSPAISFLPRFFVLHLLGFLDIQHLIGHVPIDRK